MSLFSIPSNDNKTTTTTVFNENNDTYNMKLKRHYDWSAKQGRILTGNGKATEFYTAERGYPFHVTELPHYYCFSQMRTETNEDVIDQWIQKKTNNQQLGHLCGVWNRLLFEGGMEHSTHHDEIVWNLQTNTLFIDLRIPTTKSIVLSSLYQKDTTGHPLNHCTNDELALFARQHVFCGYTKHCSTDTATIDQPYSLMLLCTRHHCIDWNFIGTPRPRPNKWYAEFSTNFQKFKEWSYATDQQGQSYYTETWERAPTPLITIINTSSILPILALRIAPDDRGQIDDIWDGMIVAIGDHFNYAIDRRPRQRSNNISSTTNNYATKWDYFDSSSRNPPTNFVDWIDFELKNGKRDNVISHLLSIDAGHGRIELDFKNNVHWNIDCAIQPWKHNTCLFSSHDNICLNLPNCSSSVKDCQLLWNGNKWNVYECSLASVNELAAYLGCAITPSESFNGNLNNDTCPSIDNKKSACKL